MLSLLPTGWSSNRQTWKALLASVTLLGSAGLLAWYRDALPLWMQPILWGLLLLAFSLLIRRGWIRVFGPLLVYDLVRTARHGRQTFVRCVYAGILLALIFGLYVIWFPEQLDSLGGLLASPPLSLRVSANFAGSFFYLFLAVQILAVIVLTPAYTAGAIAEEKERGTFETLLTTDLRHREIVLSMVVSRLAKMALLVLAGLPILGFLQFLGGIDPNLVLAGFAFTGLTMVGLAGVSILNSVYAKRQRSAVLRSYAAIFGFFVLSILLEIGLSSAWFLRQTWAWAPLGTEKYSVSIGEVLAWPGIGNPLVVLARLNRTAAIGAGLMPALRTLLRDYAIFQVLTALLCITWAAARFRSRVLYEDTRRAGGVSPLRDMPPSSRRKLLTGLTPPARRAHIGNRPILWKALFVETRSSPAILGMFVKGIGIAIIFLPAIHILFYLGRIFPAGREDPLPWLMNLWVRVLSSLLGCSLLLVVAVRAAGSISRERGRQTLDGLLATPLTNKTILFDKWLGSILSGRSILFVLGVVWLLGLITGGLHPLAIPCLVAAWLAYAAFLAGVGLWFSVASASSHRAVFATLLTVAAVTAAFTLACYDLSDKWLRPAEALSITPPVTLGLLAFPWVSHSDAVAPGLALGRPIVPFGLVFWSVTSMILWMLVRVRFRMVTGRKSGPTARQSAVSSNAAANTGNEPNPVAVSSTTSVTRDDTDHTPPAGRWPKHLLKVLALLSPLCLVISWYAQQAHIADKKLQEAIAEADDLDPGWRLEELNAKRRQIPPRKNSAPRVVAADNLLPRNWWQMFGDLHAADIDSYPPQMQFTTQQTETLSALRFRSKAALTEARKLKDLPEGRFTISYRDNVPLSFGLLEKPGFIAWLLSVDLLLRAQEGAIDDALESCRAVVNAGRAIGDEPPPYVQLYRMQLHDLAVRRIERVLAQGRPSESALAALQNLLDDEERQPLLLIAMRGKRALDDRFMESVQRGTGRVLDQAGYGQNVLNLPPDRMWGAAMDLFQYVTVPLLSRPLKIQRAEALSFHTKLVEIAKFQPEQAPVALARQGTVSSLLVEQYLLRWFLPTLQRSQAKVRCTIVALAVERYRRAHGRWPDSLSALIPKFLEKVPIDLYDGQPLRYRRLADGVVIYSVGPDRRDDGGKINRKNENMRGTDLGIQLWDVDKRRQKP
jgi:ABC-type transport system involved in multi-copper enzyme maturation permease subunit